MSKDKSTTQDECKNLREIFVSVTGVTRTTDPQRRETGREIIDVTGSKSSHPQKRPDTEPEENGLSDTISDPEFDNQEGDRTESNSGESQV